MSITINEQRNLYEALTRHNYFPNQKHNVGELPPCVSSRQFTPEICEAVAALADSRERRENGYDIVEYKATRYNNVPRILSLVHPKAHALLSKHIHDNWDSIAGIQNNPHSLVKPEQRQDGRIMVMNYEDPISKKCRYQDSSFGRRFRVHADISNCFNSIYSHAIPWAVVGIAAAKETRRDNQRWYNMHDVLQRKCKRNETQGVPIGPATSNMSVELILGKVDEKLAAHGFDFHRYVDDYTCFCETNEQAHNFTLTLNQALSEYKLTLNLGKTRVVELPNPSDDDWVLDLISAAPNRYEMQDGNLSKFRASEVLAFLNKAVLVNKATPDGSVLKYAVQLIIHHIDDDSVYPVIDAVIELSWHYPVLIPFLEVLFEQIDVDLRPYEDKLNQIILENARLKRSDGMAWPLHIMKIRGCIPGEVAAKSIIESGDCVSIAILHSMLPDLDDINQFIQSITDKDDYTKDSFWLLLYQAFYCGQIDNPFDDDVFVVLKNNSVNFIPGDSVSPAEQECERIANDFIAELFKAAAAAEKDF